MKELIEDSKYKTSITIHKENKTTINKHQTHQNSKYKNIATFIKQLYVAYRQSIKIL
jgi:hypothetical protein